MKLRINILTFFIIISSCISFFSIIFNIEDIASGYELVVIFPLLFVLIYILTFARLDLKLSSIKITIYIYLLIQWIRYVLMPSIISYSGNNPGTAYLTPEKSSLYLASILMIFDIIIGSYLLFYFGRKKKKQFCKKILIGGNKFIYSIYILFVIAVYIIWGRNYNLFNFLYLSSESDIRISSIVSSTQVTLIRQIIVIAIIIIFVWSINVLAKKYRISKNSIYYYYALFFALINISIIIGESRTVQLYSTFVSVLIINYAFPSFKKKTIFIVGGAAAVILVFLSIYKFFFVFRYGSYVEAIKNSSFSFSTISQILQSYFLGPQGLGVAIEFSSKVDLSILDICFDFVRSTVPFSFLVKGDSLLTSQLFNNYIYNGRQLTGHLLSSIAYGYIFFGIPLASIFSVINILISVYVETKLNKSRSYEMMYIWGYILIRAAQNIISATPSIFMNASIMLITGGLLFKVSNILKFKKKFSNYHSIINKEET